MRTTQRMGTGLLSSFIENVFVRIITDNDIVGFGEAAPWSIFCDESPPGIVYTILELFSPIMLGRNPWEWRRIRNDLDRAVLGCHYAKSAIEMAIFDVLAKEVRLPLHQFLGGPIRDSIPLSYSLSSQNVTDEIGTVSRLYEDGYSIFKVKAGVLPPKDDVVRLRELRAAFPDIELRLDFNEAGSITSMLELLPVIKECGINVIEQPFTAGDIVSMRWLTQNFEGILVADESCRNMRDLISLVNAGGFHAVSLKIQKMGGISKALMANTVATANGLASYCGGTSDSALAAAVAVELGVCFSHVLSGCDLYFPFEIIDNPPELSLPRRHNGSLFPTEAHGIGVSLPSEWFDG